MNAAAGPEPQPLPRRSRWHDWWKFPLFFGVLAGAIALEAYGDGKGGILLLLLLVYVVVRGVASVFRKRKTEELTSGRGPCGQEGGGCSGSVIRQGTPPCA